MANGNNGTAATTESLGRRIRVQFADPTKSAFFWLSAFFVVYCARPEDWIPGLKLAPLAKITAILAMWGLFNYLGRTKRSFRDVPRKGNCFLAMIVLLFVGGFFSPIWRGGAVNHTIDFSKVYIAWMLTFLSDHGLRSFAPHHLHPGGVGGDHLRDLHHQGARSAAAGRRDRRDLSNPNDLAFAIVLTLPFALAFMTSSKSFLKRALWVVAMLIMLAALFLTASRAGFIDLVISGAVTLWHFGIRGKTPGLLVGIVLSCVLLMSVAGGKLYDRFQALSGDSTTEESAYGSYQDRMYLMERAWMALSNIHFRPRRRIISSPIR